MEFENFTLEFHKVPRGPPVYNLDHTIPFQPLKAHTDSEAHDNRLVFAKNESHGPTDYFLKKKTCEMAIHNIYNFLKILKVLNSMRDEVQNFQNSILLVERPKSKLRLKQISPYWDLKHKS